MKKYFNNLSFLLVLFVDRSVISYSATKIQDILASTCKPLTITCEISDISKATVVHLSINNNLIQGMNLAKKKTECPENKYRTYCLSRMKGSHLAGNKMYFKIDLPWLELNQSITHCVVRYSDGRGNQNIYGRIDLHSCQDGNSSSVANSTPTTNPTVSTISNPVTSQANVSSCTCPNITQNVTNNNEPAANKDNSGKFSTAEFVGASIGSFFGGIIFTVIAYYVYKKCKKPPDSVNCENGEVLGLQDVNQNGVTASDTTQVENK